MRVSDPFDDVQVEKSKAILVGVAVLALIALYAILFPAQGALVAMIVAFFVIIMLHELGHLILAKRSGMKVTEYFVGFGPRLWSFKKGETEYGLKAVPLGGYCRIIGMTNLEEVAPEDEPRAYRSKSWHAKVATAAAGPAVHFIIAIVLMFTVLFFAGDYRNEHATTNLSTVTQGAQTAGLQPGDRVVSINGSPVNSWDQVPSLINPRSHPAHAGDVVHITVERGDVLLERDVVLQKSTEPGNEGRIVAGIGPHTVVPHPSLVSAVTDAPRQVADVSWESVKAIGSVFSPSGISNYFRILSGNQGSNTNQNQRFVSPVGFGQLANDAVKSGWVTAFGLLIAINVFVGLFNLLPLLPFDGGHIAIASYEKVASWVRRKRVQVDVAKLMPLTVGVMAVLGFIFLSSLFLDITHPVANPF